MQTVAEPDLDAWIQGEIVKPCSCRIHKPTVHPCPRTADFLISTFQECTGHAWTDYYCASHKDGLLAGIGLCRTCGEPSLNHWRITWIERSR